MTTMLINSNQNKYKSSQQQQLETILANQHFTSAQSLSLGSQLLGELEPPQSVRERHTEQGQMSAFPHLTHRLKGVSLGCFTPLAPELCAVRHSSLKRGLFIEGAEPRLSYRDIALHL